MAGPAAAPAPAYARTAGAKARPAPRRTPATALARAGRNAGRRSPVRRAAGNRPAMLRRPRPEGPGTMFPRRTAHRPCRSHRRRCRSGVRPAARRWWDCEPPAGCRSHPGRSRYRRSSAVPPIHARSPRHRADARAAPARTAPPSLCATPRSGSSAARSRSARSPVSVATDRAIGMSSDAAIAAA